MLVQEVSSCEDVRWRLVLAEILVMRMETGLVVDVAPLLEKFVCSGVAWLFQTVNGVAWFGVINKQ